MGNTIMDIDIHRVNVILCRRASHLKEKVCGQSINPKRQRRCLECVIDISLCNTCMHMFRIEMTYISAARLRLKIVLVFLLGLVPCSAQPRSENQAQILWAIWIGSTLSYYQLRSLRYTSFCADPGKFIRIHANIKHIQTHPDYPTALFPSPSLPDYPETQLPTVVLL